MIRIKLDQIAKKLGKNISEISRETDLNRNTITALYHGKIDGIKFETLNILCEKYGLNINDILQFDSGKSQNIATAPEYKIYKQEGESAPFTMFPLFAVFNKFPKKYFDWGFDTGHGFFKNDYGEWYWNNDAMDAGARKFYQRYNNKAELKDLYSAFMEKAKKLENYYLDINLGKLPDISNQELLSRMNNLRKMFEEYWAISMFIDCFDPGFDQEEIKRIAEENNLDIDEVAVLTTPMELTFNNDRTLDLLKIIKPLMNSKTNDKKVEDFVKENREIKKHIRRFDYSNTNYAHNEPITDEYLIKEIRKYVGDKALYKKEFGDLSGYSKNQEQKVKKVLAKHGLKNNPLWFFEKLTFWREERKKYSIMAIYVFYVLLKIVSERTGISEQYLKYADTDELSGAFKGLLSNKTLQERKEKGMIVVVKTNDYYVLENEQAISLREELESRLKGLASGEIIPGSVASRGYARGIAKVVLNKEDFSKLQEGEILITGMTRPEFLPVIRRSAGIVTNEGGITCHAAIVSRELNKPCIIGTKNATQLIHDGDLIEVRANHGTVRILERA